MYSIIDILSEMNRRNASDLYLNIGSAPSLRVDDSIVPLGQDPLEEKDINEMIAEIVEVKQLTEFEEQKELNCSIYPGGLGRYRVNLFYQRQKIGAVIRRIKSEIPNLSTLGLPEKLADYALLKRGLIIIIGQTGSGKSTTAAAIIEERNKKGNGHIITIEDPVEFVHEPKNCIFTQREIGIDTDSFSTALKNALRQRPDVVFIGEIRDRECMEHAMHFAETGHLCISTLHATDCAQAVERIANFFPMEHQKQKLMSLSSLLKVVIGQRLLNNVKGSKSLATEIMLNQGYINTLIQEGKFKDIKEHIAKAADQGMHTFDQAIIDLLKRGVITEKVALDDADNPINMQVSIKLGSGGQQKRLSLGTSSF